MNIYVSHSKDLDYRNGLYLPLRNSRLNNEHHIILPHEFSESPYSSKEFFRDICELVVAEVSFKSTGLGIELGWADAFGVQIIAMHMTGVRPSSSVRTMTNRVIPYENPEEMIRRLEEEIDKIKG